MAKTSTAFEVGDSVRLSDGKVGRVEHLSFDLTGMNQLLVRTGADRCAHNSKISQPTCARCPVYYDEDDAVAI